MTDVPSTYLLQILELKDEVKRLRAKVAEIEAGSEAVGWLTEEGLFTKIPVTVMVQSGRWKPLFTTPQPVGVFDPMVKVEAGSGRPDCFEFAMDFLGEPEESRIRAYVERLEAMLTEQEKQQ